MSALLGIAVSEGYVQDIEDPIGKYVPEFVGTDLETIPIRACLQMASGIDFDEDTDMSGFSMRTLLGSPAMKVIAKYGVQEAPYTYRRYLSINTEILGAVIPMPRAEVLPNIWRKSCGSALARRMTRTGL